MYEDYEHHFYEIFDFEVPLYGYIWPILVIFTTCCNILVIAGFLRPRMRNATNILLIAIAVSDSLTGLVTLPGTIHVFSQRNFFLTKDWCNVSMMSRLFVSRAFHTVSVWLTLLLAVYRVLQIRRPLLAERLCTIRKTLVAIPVMYVLAFGLHIYHAFNVKAQDGFCHWVLETPCRWTCVYIWVALLFGHLLPCFFLVLLAVLMVQTIRNISMSETTLQSRKRMEKKRSATIVVILIVVIFLIPELPYGVFYLITVSLRHGDKEIFPLKTNRLIHCLYDILLVISFHLNFWVYCILVRKFRSCLKSLIGVIMCKRSESGNLVGEQTSSSGAEHELVGMNTIVERTENENDESA